MESQPHIADALARMIEAYAQSWSGITRSPGLSDGAPQVTEYWLRIARTMKESYVNAVNVSFDLWESQCRSALASLPGLDAWARLWPPTSGGP